MFVRVFGPENETGGGAAAPEPSAPAAPAAPAAPTAETSAAAPKESTAPSMEDTIRQTYAKLQGKGERQRGPDGKFVGQTAAHELGTEAQTDTTTVVTDDQQANAAAAVAATNTNPDNLEFTDNSGGKHAVDISQPPQSWRAEAKAEYAKLSESARREIHKREHEFHTGIAQYKGAAQFAQTMLTEFKPYEALIRSQNHTPAAMTRDFLNVHYTLSTGTPQQKVAAVIEGAAKYGVTVQDLQAAFGNVQSTPQGEVHPLVTQLQKQVQELTGKITEQEQRSVRDVQTEAQTSIERFANEKAPDGKPKHEFFQKVAVDMGALIETGRAVDMDDAYNKAIWINPEVRATLMARQAEAERKTAAEKAAAARQAASVNVPVRGKHPSVTPVGSTMEETIRNTYRKLNGGA